MVLVTILVDRNGGGMLKHYKTKVMFIAGCFLGICFFIVSYIISYPVVLPLLEKCYPPLGYIIYEPLESLRNKHIGYWKFTEYFYYKCGGQRPPGKRYYYNTTRRDYIFDKNGKVVQSIELLHEKWFGEWIFYEGNRFIKIDFFGGIPNGSFIATYPQPNTNKIETIYTIFCGFITKQINLFENGNIKSEIDFTEKTEFYEKTISRYCSYYEQKEFQKKIELLFDRGAYVKATYWDELGNIIAEGTFKEDKIFQGTFKIDVNTLLYVHDGNPIRLETCTGDTLTNTSSSFSQIKERCDAFYRQILYELNYNTKETEAYLHSLLEFSVSPELRH